MPAWPASSRSVRRHQDFAGACAVEALEGRVHLHGGPLTLEEWIGSAAPVYAIGEGTSAGGSGGSQNTSAAISRLIGLDRFRADPRFAGIDGRGSAAVVIDSGIDLDHPFFGPDANHNGVADRIVYSYDYSGRDSDAGDHSGHGTNVSSIIASSDSAYPGVAPGVSIIHLKVFNDRGGGGNFGVTEQALRWVVANARRYNIVSVNLSLGDNGNYQTAQSLYGVSDELAQLAAMDVIVCAAAGNDYAENHSAPGLAYPAADPSVLAVGAVFDASVGGVRYAGGARAMQTGADRITPFSQRSGSLWEIFAPGAPVPGAAVGGGVASEDGTSQASPHVAGVVALMQQLAERVLGRRLRLEEFRTLLMQTGKRIVDGDDERDNVRHTGAAFRRLDVEALAAAIWRAAGPEVRVEMGTSAVASGTGSVAFGSTGVGASVVKTVMVENTGVRALTLRGLRAPAGYSVVEGFGSLRLAPGEATSFTVRLDGGTAGKFAGMIQFRTNDRDEGSYRIAVTGEVRALTMTVDDGTAGTRFDGAWTVVTTGIGGDARVSGAGGAGEASASWTFTGLLPGRYRVSGAWNAAAVGRGGGHALYGVDDGMGHEGSVVIDQGSFVADRKDYGVGYEDVGEFTVAGTRVVVVLRSIDGAPVVADTVRVERIGGVPGGAAAVVSYGSTALGDDGAATDFGRVVSGTPAVRSFTLRNVGNGVLDLGAGGAVLPEGFSFASAPARVLTPGSSTTFSVRLDAGAPGAVHGTMVLGGEGRTGFRVNLAGMVLPFTRIMDDGESGVVVAGGAVVARGGFRGDARVMGPAEGGAGGMAASWTFTRLPPGRYRLMATWAPASRGAATLASSAGYTVRSGAAVLGTASVDQRVAPADQQMQGAWWARLGEFVVSGNTLSVELGLGADGVVLADGVWLERVGN